MTLSEVLREAAIKSTYLPDYKGDTLFERIYSAALSYLSTKEEISKEKPTLLDNLKDLQSIIDLYDQCKMTPPEKLLEAHAFLKKYDLP